MGRTTKQQLFPQQLPPALQHLLQHEDIVATVVEHVAWIMSVIVQITYQDTDHMLMPDVNGVLIYLGPALLISNTP